jgi:hypothetical protein
MNGFHVGRSFKSATFIAPLVFLILFLGLLVFSMQNRWGTDALWIVFAGISFVWLVAAASYVHVGRRVLDITDDGFQVEDTNGQREYRDDQVTQVRYKSVVNYANGTAKSITDTIELHVEEGGEKRWIPMYLQHQIGETSLLSQFANRLLKKIIDRGRAALDSGGTIQGEAWSWRGDSVTITEKGRAPQSLRVADVTNVDVFDSHLCVWTGSDLPTARVPEFTSNVHLLSALLNEKMPKREGPSPGLGRVLFERKSTRSTIIIVGACSVLLALTWIGVGIVAAVKRNLDAALWAGGLFVVGSLFQLGYSYCKRAYFRCHENGVSQRGLLSENKLRYDEIATFTYQATRHFHNGVYTGTHVSLHFFPTKASGDKPIKYNSTIQNADDALDRLRSHISGVMALVLYKAYQAGTPIVWTSNLRLIPGEGIEYKPAGLLGRKDPVTYAWEDVKNFDLQQGFLHIWVNSAQKSVVQEPCSAPNFFPGLAVFAMLLKDKGVAKELAETQNETAM